LDIVRRAQTDFEKAVEVCQVVARFEALDELVFIRPSDLMAIFLSIQTLQFKLCVGTTKTQIGYADF